MTTKVWISFTILCLLAVGLAAQLPSSLQQPEVATMVYTHTQLMPAAHSAQVPVTGSLDCAVWPLREFVSSLRKLVSLHDRSRFIEWGNDRAQVGLSLSAGAALEGDDNDVALFQHQGMELDASYGSRFSMWARWWAGHYTGDLTWANRHSPLVHGWLKHQDGGIYVDDLDGWMAANTDFGSFALGRGSFQVGNGIGGSIILSRDAGNYGWGAWELDAGPVRLSLLHGTLLADQENALYEDGRMDERYLMLHRLDVRLHRRFNLFFGETIIYGNRAPDASYLLPHAFLRIVEHKLHNRDNVGMFAGFTWNATDRLTVYGQGYLDELRKDEIFGDWWGNKYAIQTGAALEVGHLPGGAPRVAAEFVAIRPWLYSHNTAVGAYTHDGYFLGYPLGANLLAYTAEVNLPVWPSLSLDGQLSYVRQGSVGADPTVNYDTRPSDSAGWLEGVIDDTLYFTGVAAWQPLAHHFIRVGCKVKAENTDDNHYDWFTTWQVRY